VVRLAGLKQCGGACRKVFESCHPLPIVKNDQLRGKNEPLTDSLAWDISHPNQYFSQSRSYHRGKQTTIGVSPSIHIKQSPPMVLSLSEQSQISGTLPSTSSTSCEMLSPSSSSSPLTSSAMTAQLVPMKSGIPRNV
jgi:hypothetical protein